MTEPRTTDGEVINVPHSINPSDVARLEAENQDLRAAVEELRRLVQGRRTPVAQAASSGVGGATSRSDMQLVLPKKNPPSFSGDAKDFVMWAEDFTSYANCYDFECVLNGDVSLDLGDVNVDSESRLNSTLREQYNLARIASWALREASRDVVYRAIVSKFNRMDVVWEALSEKYRPKTYARCQTLFKDFALSDLEEGKDPVLYLDHLERLQAEMEKCEAIINDKVVYCRFLMGLSFEYDVIKQRFSGKKLVREKLVASVSNRFSELRLLQVSSAMLANHSRNSVICYNCSRPGHVSRQYPERRRGNRNMETSSVTSNGSRRSNSTASTCSMSSASSSNSRKKGGKRKPRRKKDPDLAVSNVAVCATVQEEAEILADSFFASVNVGCSSLEHASRTANERGASRGMDDIEIDSDNVAFVVTSESKRMNLDFLPRLPGIPKAQQWLADTGANRHLTNSQFGMTNFRPVSNGVVRSASGSRMKVTGIGNLDLLFFSNGKVTPVHLTDVLLVPECTANLFSLSAWERAGNDYSGSNGSIKTLGANLVFKSKNGLYVQGAYRTNRKFRCERARNVSDDGCTDSDSSDCDVSSSNVSPQLGRSGNASAHEAVLVPSSKPDKRASVNINTFHQTHAHVNARLLLKTAAHIGVKLTGKLHECSGCSQAKGVRYPVRKKASVRATRRLQRIHADLVGPKRVKTIEGQSYALLLRDDYSRFSWVYLLRSKDQTSKALQRFLADTRNDGVVETIRSDNGGEFLSEFSRVCDLNKVKREFTMPGTPQLNGSVERYIALISAAGLAARIHAKENFPGVPVNVDSLWRESLRWATDAFNRTATRANPGMKSPFYRYYGKEPEFMIRPFLRPGFYRRTKRRKDEPRAAPCFYLASAPNHPSGSARVLVKGTRSIVITRDLTWLHQSKYGMPNEISPAPLDSDPGGTDDETKSSTDDETKSSADDGGVDDDDDDDDGDDDSGFFYSTETLRQLGSENVERQISTGDSSVPVERANVPSASLTPVSSRSRVSRRDSVVSQFSEEKEELILQEEKDELPSRESLVQSSPTSRAPRSAQTLREERRLAHFNVGPADEGTRRLGRTRSQTQANSQSSGPPRSFLSTLLAKRDESMVGRLKEESGRLAAYVAHDQFELSEESPIGKKLEAVGPEPETFSEANKSPYKEVWRQAMVQEIEGLVANDTFTISELPPGRKALSARWVFKYKASEHGEITRAKCRLVARGFLQEPGVDFVQCYSPTPRAASIRLLVGVAVKDDMSLMHLDVIQAFVQADLSEEIYLKLPPGCGDLTGKIARLNKSLYGLRQASLEFNKLLSRTLAALGFEQSAVDPCVFRLLSGRDKKVEILLLCHVDDLMVAGSVEKVKWLVEKLNQSFKTNHLGGLSHYNGCAFVRNRKAGTMKMHQKACIDKLVDRFGVTTSCRNPSSSPDFVRAREVTEEQFEGSFRHLVGGLLWIASMTRPDVANAVREVARQAHDPSPRHWKAAVKILQYLKGTRDVGLSFSSRRSDQLVAFADASFADKNNDRRSVSGSVILFAGGAISWFSRTQRCVSLSTSEAEYVSIADSLKDVLFLRGLLGFMRPSSAEQKVILFEDNEGAVRLANNPLSSLRSKHIDVRYHFIRNEVNEGRVEVKHVRTESQRADVLTKPLPLDLFVKHRLAICGC